jgi:hypothetical protein
MTFARVQNASDGTNSTSLTINLGAPPTTGNLLIAWANSDATVSIGGTGWTAGPSVIDGNGAYVWWKAVGASEPASVAFTPSVSDYITAGLLEYSGNTASPLDAASSSTHSGGPVSSTGTVTVTTGADHDLGIACGLLHSSSPNVTAPTAPAWTNGWSNIQAQGATPGSYACWSYIGDNLDLGVAGSVSTAVSWSTVTWLDAQELLLVFKAAATPAGQWAPQLVTPNQGFF